LIPSTVRGEMPVEIAAGLVDLPKRELVVIWHERNHAGKALSID